jgi:DNA-binding NarL/FixJ family response regulator
VARAVALIPDLLFGSNVIGALKASGHDPVLVANASDLQGALDDADVLIVDLTADPGERIDLVRPILSSNGSLKSLAFFSHVERDVGAEAKEAGFDLVVPRSRMARAGGELVSQLVQSAG